MEFTFNRLEAKALCEQAAKTCAMRDKESLDSCFVFDIQNGEAFVKTINGIAEQKLKFPIDTESSDSISFGIRGQDMLEFLKSFQYDLVCCSVKKDKIQFSSENKKSKFARPIVSATDYAPLNFIPQHDNFTCDGPMLANAFKATYFAVSKDPSQGATSSVHLVVTDTTITVEATDRERLQHYHYESEVEINKPYECLIPSDIAEILSSLLSDVSEPLVELGEKHIRFTWDDCSFTTTLISDDGNSFPDLTKFIENDAQATVKVSRGDLISALKFAGLTVKDSFMELEVTPEGLMIKALNQDIGASNENLNCEEIEGTAKALFPWKLVMQAVEGTAEAYIYLNFCEIKAPVIVLKICDNEYTSVVLPVMPK